MQVPFNIPFQYFYEQKNIFFCKRKKNLSLSLSFWKYHTDLKPHGLILAVFLFIVLLRENIHVLHCFGCKKTVFFTLDTGYCPNWHFVFIISYICIFHLNHLHFKFFMCIPEELQAFLKVVINSFYNSLLLVKNLYLFNVGYLIFQ